MRLFSRSILVALALLLCGAAIGAQAVYQRDDPRWADDDPANDPNTCFESGTCVTEADWRCGWDEARRLSGLSGLAGSHLTCPQLAAQAESMAGAAAEAMRQTQSDESRADGAAAVRARSFKLTGEDLELWKSRGAIPAYCVNISHNTKALREAGTLTNRQLDPNPTCHTG